MHDSPALSGLASVIDNREIGTRQYEVLGLCLLVAVLDGFDTQLMGFVVKPMADSLAVAPSSFGPVFAAALFGLMVGALALAPLADLVGRKRVLISSVVIFGAFALLTAFVERYDDLVRVRFMTGLGLGGAIPNLVALAAEYMPRRSARSAVTLIFCGMPLGAVAAGLATQWLLGHWNWQALFVMGGVLPLLTVGLIALRLPESIEFLTRSPQRQAERNRVLATLFPAVDPTGTNRPQVQPAPPRRMPVGQLFRQGLWRSTLLLWLPYAMNLLILYSIMSWIPTVLATVAAPLSAGVLAIVLFSLGGVVGSLLQGHAMNRYGAYPVLLAEFAAYLVLVLLMSVLPVELGRFLPMMFGLGILVQGAQAGLNAVAVEIYPPAVRSTGVGWALGIGRIGSILGPIAGGLMLGQGWSLQQIFLAALVPGALALGAVLALLLAPTAIRPPRAAESLPNPSERSSS